MPAQLELTMMLRTSNVSHVHQTWSTTPTLNSAFALTTFLTMMDLNVLPVDLNNFGTPIQIYVNPVHQLLPYFKMEYVLLVHYILFTILNLILVNVQLAHQIKFMTLTPTNAFVLQ